MKKLLLIIPTAALLIYCSSSKTATTATTSNQSAAAGRVNLPDHSDTSQANSDSVIITGSQYIPIEGKSEFGTLANLEGAWVLTTINGSAIPGKSNINTDLLSKKMPAGSEIRHDSLTTTETINGVTQTTTTVLVDKTGTTGNKITPPQGSNYHIPEKPSINFYGSNETFSGFTGCNKFAGRYSVHGTNSINLQSAAASTKMVCLGDYDETAFLNTLRRANYFRAKNGQLELMEGDSVILVFAKK